MSTHGIRDLAHNTNAVISEVRETGEVALITKNGKAVAGLVPLQELEDLVLATQFDSDIEEGRKALKAGKSFSLKHALEVLED